MALAATPGRSTGLPEALPPARQPPSPDEVLLVLARVVASDSFRGSRRSRDFLTYVVAEALAGRGTSLSERTVGRHALHYGDDFDGRVNTSVRVRANRVRRALRQYYEGSGASDAVRIELPLGSYLPRFTRRPEAAPAPAARGIGVGVVVPHAVGPTASVAVPACIVVETLVGGLATMPGLRIVGPRVVHTLDARQVGRELDARFVVQGSVVLRADELRLAARLTDTSSGEVAWSVVETFAGRSLADAAEGWAEAVVGQLLEPGGVLSRAAAEASRDGAPDASP